MVINEALGFKGYSGIDTKSRGVTFRQSILREGNKNGEFAVEFRYRFKDSRSVSMVFEQTASDWFGVLDLVHAYQKPFLSILEPTFNFFNAFRFHSGSLTPAVSRVKRDALVRPAPAMQFEYYNRLMAAAEKSDQAVWKLFVDIARIEHQEFFSNPKAAPPIKLAQRFADAHYPEIITMEDRTITHRTANGVDNIILKFKALEWINLAHVKGDGTAISAHAAYNFNIYKRGRGMLAMTGKKKGASRSQPEVEEALKESSPTAAARKLNV
ncbi:MAG: hypothetical protein HY209_02340 [Candidatus Omnitrophica bacterium]|nr:hypothetical protein [Candidatus Omnitrophota bacterium]